MGKLRHYLLNPLNLLKLLLERSGANHHTTDDVKQDVGTVDFDLQRNRFLIEVI